LGIGKNESNSNRLKWFIWVAMLASQSMIQHADARGLFNRPVAKVRLVCRLVGETWETRLFAGSRCFRKTRFARFSGTFATGLWPLARAAKTKTTPQLKAWFLFSISDRIDQAVSAA
jgi:hypothetical protein